MKPYGSKKRHKVRRLGTKRNRPLRTRGAGDRTVTRSGRKSERQDAARALLAQPWPYGPPDHHQECCSLFRGATFCDCLASDADDLDWGRGAG